MRQPPRPFPRCSKSVRSTASSRRDPPREQEQNRLRRERHEHYERETRQRELRELRYKVTQQEWLAKSIQTAARNAAVQQHRQAMVAQYQNVFNALDQHLNPPPAPEPTVEVVYVSESDDQWGTTQLGPAFNPKKRRW